MSDPKNMIEVMDEIEQLKIDIVSYLNGKIQESVDLIEEMIERLKLEQPSDSDLKDRAEDFIDENDRVYVTGQGQKLVNIHSKRDCASDESCVIHNPSIHNMLSWPTKMDEHKKFHRLCKHGAWHPDPDSVSFMVGQGWSKNEAKQHDCCKLQCCKS